MKVHRLSETLNYDLPGSAPFLRRIPVLEEVFDAEAMKDLLQDTLMEQGGEYTITACEPGKAMYLPDHVCNVQFDITLRALNGQERRALVNGRLFPDLPSCTAYYNKYLKPLPAQMEGRDDLAPFARTVAVVDAFCMALSVFPLDGLLPTLIQATDPARMVSVFNETLPDALSGEFTIRNVTLDLAHYGRYQRCVLRYLLDGEQADGIPAAGSPKHEVVYGKVDADGQGGLTVQVIGALREKLRDPNLPYYFRVPMSFGYLPDLKLLLMEALPGGPVIKNLIKEGSDDGNSWKDSDISVEEAMGICARMLLTLHTSGIKLGRRNSLEVRCASIQEEIQVVQQVYPELGDRLAAWLDEIIRYAQGFPALPLVLSHGDYTYTQLIFDGKSAGLVDFDTICQAEPGLDLGQFLAYQRLTILKDHPSHGQTVEQLCDLFLNTYIAEARERIPDEEAFRARVAAYELISLIRLVLHSWQKLKGSRLKLALTLFEERYACLKQVS